MLKNPVKVGIVGFGTVGSGVAHIILNESDNIYRNTGVRLELACVVDKDTTSARKVDLPKGLLTDNIDRLINDSDIQIGVELAGGTKAALDIHKKLLKAGKHVVTANKALISEHGKELFDIAVKKNRCIAFEASCAGGIPIISVMRTGLAANRITAFYGILNGTCNYILSNMTHKGLDFAEVLKQAQQKGYAEADPTLDINGTDSAHKLSILASLAFGHQFGLDDIHIEGIENICIDDIKNALEMGYILKLLAIGEMNEQGAVSLRVHPSFVSQDNPLARQNGPFNAVSVYGNAVGNTMYFGRGAGMMATASAVVADIIEIALGNSQRLFANMPMLTSQKKPAIQNINEVTSRYYLRLMAKDKPGVFGAYGQVLGKHGINISGAIQHEGCGPDNSVPVVITTHPVKQKNIIEALDEIKRLDIISGKPVCIRIVEIPEDKD